MKLELTQHGGQKSFNAFSDSRENLGVTGAEMWKNPETAHHFKVADLKLYCA